MAVQNPRKGTYGYLIRLGTGIDLNQFNVITITASASSNVSSMSFNTSASTAFIGNSTVYSSVEGVTLASGTWCWARNGTTDAWVTSDAYTLTVHCSATGQYFKSQGVVVSVDS